MSKEYKQVTLADTTFTSKAINLIDSSMPAALIVETMTRCYYASVINIALSNSMNSMDVATHLLDLVSRTALNITTVVEALLNELLTDELIVDKTSTLSIDEVVEYICEVYIPDINSLTQLVKQYEKKNK